MAVVAVLELSVIAAMLFALEWSNPGFLPVVCSAPESVAECASGPVAVTMVLLAALFLLALHSRRALTACQRTARDEATRKHEIAWELMAMRNSAMHSDESVRVGRSFKPQPSDVFVVTYPKCGTTWVTQILHALRTAGSMDFGEITEVVPWVILAHELTQRYPNPKPKSNPQPKPKPKPNTPAGRAGGRSSRTRGWPRAAARSLSAPA